MPRKELLEHAVSEAVAVDRELGVIKNVKVLGRDSKNGRTYTPEALQQASRLYTDKEVNLDHPDRQNARRERKITEGFGVLKNPAIRENGVYADLHYLKTHPMSEAIAERAERFPNSFGLSHNAIGQVKTGKGGNVVESVDEVFSVDLVSRPATNAGLFESEESTEQTMSKTVKELLAEHKTLPDVAHALKLLEQDEFSTMAELPVEAATSASAEDQVLSAFAQMVVAVAMDRELDKREKMRRIRQILNAEERLMQPPPVNPGDAAADEEERDPMPESDKALAAKVAKLERLNLVRDLCESAGVPFAGLDQKRQALLEAQADADAVKMIIESWATPEQPAPKQKPAIGSALKRETISESYDDLRKRELKASKRKLQSA